LPFYKGIGIYVSRRVSILSHEEERVIVGHLLYGDSVDWELTIAGEIRRKRYNNYFSKIIKVIEEISKEHGATITVKTTNNEPVKF